MTDSILRTIEPILTSSGALVERREDGALEVLASPEVSAALETPEHTTLYADPSKAPAGSTVLTYSPELWERLSALLNSRGRFAQCVLKHLYLKRGGIAAAAESVFSVLNGIGSVEDYQEEFISFLLCNFRYTALSDERKEGVVTIAVNERSGVPATDLSMVLTSLIASSESGHLPVQRRPLGEIYRVACRGAQQAVERELALFQRGLVRRLQRDVQRLREYHGTIIAEIEKKIHRRKLESSDKEVELKRVEATHLELKRKILDQRERYAMEVRVYLISAVRIFLPALVVRYRVQRRQLARDITLLWNPVRKGFDEIECEGCATALRSFSLCDERLHLLCVDCFRCTHCAKVTCAACNPKRCPKCGSARSVRSSGE